VVCLILGSLLFNINLPYKAFFADEEKRFLNQKFPPGVLRAIAVDKKGNVSSGKGFAVFQVSEKRSSLL
jgi:hypothetical protein